MKRLRDWLDKSRTSQSAFAKSIDVTQPTVSDWLTGAMSPSFDRLSKISRHTGIPVDLLVEDCARNAKKRREERQHA